MENSHRKMGWNVWLMRFTAMVVGLAGITGLSAESSDPLLDLFIQKGFVTREEAAKVKAEFDTMRSNAAIAMPSESVWKINKAIKNAELFGDIRLRYETRKAKDPSGGQIDLERIRYSLRLGLRGDVFDNFYYGLRMETSTSARSAWGTFGSSSGAPFGKSSASINLGQVYLEWRPTDWADVTVGKMNNPFYTTSMVWDGDITPEGVSERFKASVGEADLFANFGQFLYQDTNPTKATKGYFNIGYTSADMPFLLGWQLGVDYHLTKRLDFKIAPVIYNYLGQGANNVNLTSPDLSGAFVGQGSNLGIAGSPASYNLGSYNGFFANETGINDLLVLQIPWELNLKLASVQFRLFGDYAQNLHGGERARTAYVAQQDPIFAGSGIVLIPSPQTKDNKAYLVGMAIGSTNNLGMVSGATCRKHAWELRSYWQHVEQYALDPNLLDSDFFEGRANMEGIYAAAAFGFTDNVIGTFRYGYARRINHLLGTGGSNADLPQMNPIAHFNLMQFDLTLKF